MLCNSLKFLDSVVSIFVLFSISFRDVTRTNLLFNFVIVFPVYTRLVFNPIIPNLFFVSLQRKRLRKTNNEKTTQNFEMMENYFRFWNLWKTYLVHQILTKKIEYNKSWNLCFNICSGLIQFWFCLERKQKQKKNLSIFSHTQVKAFYSFTSFTI